MTRGQCTSRALGALILALTVANVARPSDEPPDLMQTLIAQDATLNNNLTPIEPRWQRNSQGRTLELGFGVEKMLSTTFEIEIGGQWESMSPRDGPARAGFGNVELALKYVFLQRSDFQIAFEPQLDFPTSSHIADEPMQVHAGGFFSWGGRLGSGVVEHGWPSFLRAIELQGDLGFSHAFGSGHSDEVFFDPVVDYSMPYLAYATDTRIPWPLKKLCPFSELNFSQSLDGGDQHGLSLFVTPGVAYLTETYQLTVGVQVPVTHAAVQSSQVSLVGSAMIFLDKLSPRFGWTPF
ncbi:MAG TPA: hypothetical protein VEU51_08905 [Candidatus Acidoferrales bacterium]|nr:hypothetical protein [Candidatus Acidoferrales bacterium]